MARDVVLVLTRHELRNVKDALTKYENWIHGDTEPGAAADRRAVARIFDQIATQEAKADQPEPARAPVQPRSLTFGERRCRECGHPLSRHNDLAYCLVRGASSGRGEGDCTCGSVGYTSTPQALRRIDRAEANGTLEVSIEEHRRLEARKP